MAEHARPRGDARRERLLKPAEPHPERPGWCEIDRLAIEAPALQGRDQCRGGCQIRGIHSYGRVRLRFWKHLEGQLRKDPEPTATADERLVEQEAGCFLHDLAAALNYLPAAVDDACTDEEVADAAEPVTAGAIHAGGDGAANCRTSRGERRGGGGGISLSRGGPRDVRGARGPPRRGPAPPPRGACGSPQRALGRRFPV